MNFSRDPHHQYQNNYSRIRPHTPQPYQHQYRPINHRQNQQPQWHYPNLTKSRLSVNSSDSGLAFLGHADHNEMFPEDLIFLLKNQDKNINHFKEKIEKEKSKVQNDFGVWKSEIEHIIEDLKISVQAQLDLVYKTFITKYAQMKSEVQELRKLRKEILLHSEQHGGQHPYNSQHINSNKDLIQEIQKDAEHFRSYKIYGYLSEIIKQKLEPILELSTQLILIGSTECPFYRNKQMNDSLKHVKGDINNLLCGIYTHLENYILSPQAIVDKERIITQHTVVHSIDVNHGHPIQIHKSPQVVHIVNEPRQFQIHGNHIPQPQQYPHQIPIPQHQSQYIQQSHNLNNSPSKYKLVNNNTISTISRTQQSLLTKWCQSINLNKLETIQTDHSDSILCIFFVADRFIATGSKDKTINIYSLEGNKITTLKGHQAAICCLSSAINYNNSIFLASGSDHGCSCLILWDIKLWTICSRIQAHTAAVTAIVDLQDGYHLVTGSYDKKINLYNFVKGHLAFSLNNNKTSVTGIILSTNKSKLISSGLDNGLTIWSIQRKNNIVDSILFQRTIMNNTLVCSLAGSQLKSQYVLGGTRDGKIKLFNIQSGSIQKTYTVNQNSVIELVLIEREIKDDSPITLSCSSKDKSLIIMKMESGISNYLHLDTSLSIEFGCGIGPKIVMSKARNGIMAIVSQSNLKKQFTIFQIGLK